MGRRSQLLDRRRRSAESRSFMPSARHEAGLPVWGTCEHKLCGDENHRSRSYPRMLMIGTDADFRPMRSRLGSSARRRRKVLASVEEVAVRFGKVGSGGLDVEF